MGRTISDEDSPEPLALGQNRRNQRRVGPDEYTRRRSLLHDDPDIDVVDMATLIAVANAIEEESVRRYAMLAELMDRRGEPATAAAFRVMLEEERGHVVAVDRWAASLGKPLPAPQDFEWQLPADLSTSWDEVSRSPLLTPYRAFAMAVENEQRAFSFYAYLAAHAENPQIAAEAERLGAEELRHASLLRRWRRQAYHRERQTTRPEPVEIDSVEGLREHLAQRESDIATTHLALARRLVLAGDEASALQLERSIPTTARPTTARPTTARPPVQGTTTPPDAASPETAGALRTDEPRHLLVDAQKPLEALANTLEDVMASADGDLFEEAARAMESVVKRIAQISLQIGRSDQAQVKQKG